MINLILKIYFIKKFYRKNEVKKKKIERIPKSNTPINFINKNDSCLANNYYKYKYNEIINNKYKVSI